MIPNLIVMLQFFRKQLAFLILFMALTVSVFAQKSGNSVKLFTGSKWFKKFSVGINAGVLKSSVLAGGSNDFTENDRRFGYGLNIKYQLTHYLALQTDFIRGKLSGDQGRAQGTDTLNLSKPVTSFRTDLHIAAAISAIYTFSNINWLQLKNWFVPYIGIGGGLANYDVKFTPKGSTERYYPYGLKNNITELYVPIIMGVRFRLTKMLNLDVGYTMNYTDGDNLDGFAYWRVPQGYSSTVHKDKFGYTHAGLEISLGKKSKEQLLFDNPVARLNNNLQTQITNLGKRLDTLESKQEKGLEDSDGDGVADLFDKEPNTPAGCPVDAHGVMRDTDGDGVPDCKDKQLISPTECQPVDADGVGKCPDPACCKGRTGDIDGDPNANLKANCPSDYPSLTFRGNSIKLSGESESIVATIAAKMKAKPDCKIVIKGVSETSKSSQALCQKRVDAVRNQLKEKEGISADRITTNCEVGGAGDKNTVQISSN